MCVQGGLAFNPTNVTALSLSSTFFNYAPCLIQEAAAGAAFTAAGINFVPQVQFRPSQTLAGCCLCHTEHCSHQQLDPSGLLAGRTLMPTLPHGKLMLADSYHKSSCNRGLHALPLWTIKPHLYQQGTAQRPKHGVCLSQRMYCHVLTV